MSEEGEEQLLTIDDNNFVFIRLKAIIGSSGSTWASETVRLRQRHPDILRLERKVRLTAFSSESSAPYSSVLASCM